MDFRLLPLVELLSVMHLICLLVARTQEVRDLYRPFKVLQVRALVQRNEFVDLRPPDNVGDSRRTNDDVAKYR